jgi:hypothetical protein
MTAIIAEATGIATRTTMIMVVAEHTRMAAVSARQDKQRKVGVDRF